MTARGFEYYGQTVAPVAPVAPQPARTQPQPVQPTVTAQPQAPAAFNSAARLLEAMVSLFVFAVALIAAGLIVNMTPLGRIDADITVPFVVVVLAVLTVIVARWVRQ